jgi:hypothetical protein
MGIDHPFPFRLGADAVFPVVLIGKAAAGPAYVRGLYFFKGRSHIVPDAPGIGNRRTLSYPVTAINTAPQVFRKMTVNMPADFNIPILGFNYNSVHDVLLIF